MGCEDSFAGCPCTQRRGGIDVVEAGGREVIADSESLLFKYVIVYLWVTTLDAPVFLRI